MGDKMNFEIVKKEIDKWDPIGLLSYAPLDEYDIECREIFSRIQNNDAKQNGMIIYKIFSEAFGATFDKSIDECVYIAKKIMEGK